mgnify:FL=1
MRFDYGAVISAWDLFLRRLGFAYEGFYRIDRIGEFDLVILPFSSCLSDYEAERIKDFVARGGRVFLTGAVGSRFADGRWRDEPVFGDIVGARFVGNANPSPRGPARITLNRELPVSLRWTPRSVLEIPTYNQVLVVRPIGRRMNIVGRTPFAVGEESFEDLTAFCYGPYLQGRVAWSGFRIGAFPTGDEIAKRAFRELFANTIAWLTDRPRVTTPLWPDGNRAALGLAVDASAGSALRLFSRVSESEHPVGILVTPREAREFASLPGVGGLRNVEWIVHLDREYLAALSSTPEDWLLRLRERIGAALDAPVRGILYESGDTRRVARLALGAGFSYLLAPPTDGILEYPEIFASRRPLGPFEAPVTLALAPFREFLPERFEPTACSFVILESEEYLAAEDPLAFAGDRRGEVWVARPGEIVDWRSDRNSVVMDEQFLPGRRLRLRISNGSYSTFRDFPFRIRFRDPATEVSIWPKAVGLDPPETVSRDGDTWTFAIGRFGSGRTLEYIFTPLEPGERPESG